MYKPEGALPLASNLDIRVRSRRLLSSSAKYRTSPCSTSSVPNATPPVATAMHSRSEEHTSELQSRQYLVCRLLLEKKKNINIKVANNHSPRIKATLVAVPSLETPDLPLHCPCDEYISPTLRRRHNLPALRPSSTTH